MVTGHDLYELLFSDGNKRSERHLWTTVSKVNADKTVSIKLNESVDMDCKSLCAVAPNDRVLALLFNDGEAVVLGKAWS